jgi:hypothetical protein
MWPKEVESLSLYLEMLSPDMVVVGFPEVLEVKVVFDSNPLIRVYSWDYFLFSLPPSQCPLA